MRLTVRITTPAVNQGFVRKSQMRQSPVTGSHSKSRQVFSGYANLLQCLRNLRSKQHDNDYVPTKNKQFTQFRKTTPWNGSFERGENLKLPVQMHILKFYSSVCNKSTLSISKKKTFSRYVRT